MPLFRDNPIRAGAIGAMVLFVGYYATKLMSSIYAFHLTQTSVAILAIAALMAMVTMHNRREAQFLSQTEQEMVLIGGMALFWIAALVAWRAMRGESIGGSGAAQAVSTALGGRRGRSDDWPCGRNDAYCVVEEYNYW